MAMPLVGFLTFPGAWAAGLYVGLLFDLAAILVFGGLPRLVAVVALQFYWLALAANRLYYDYFHDVLHPAVVRSHGADVPYLKDALAQMMARGAMMWSFLLFVLSLAFVRKGGHPRLVGVGVFVAGLAAFFRGGIPARPFSRGSRRNFCARVGALPPRNLRSCATLPTACGSAS